MLPVTRGQRSTSSAAEKYANLRRKDENIAKRRQHRIADELSESLAQYERYDRRRPAMTDKTPRRGPEIPEDGVKPQGVYSNGKYTQTVRAISKTKKVRKREEARKEWAVVERRIRGGVIVVFLTWIFVYLVRRFTTVPTATDTQHCEASAHGGTCEADMFY